MFCMDYGLSLLVFPCTLPPWGWWSPLTQKTQGQKKFPERFSSSNVCLDGNFQYRSRPSQLNSSSSPHSVLWKQQIENACSSLKKQEEAVFNMNSLVNLPVTKELNPIWQLISEEPRCCCLSFPHQKQDDQEQVFLHLDIYGKRQDEDH